MYGTEIARAAGTERADAVGTEITYALVLRERVAQAELTAAAVMVGEKDPELMKVRAQPT
eukprot:2245719-Rhodomonas_salina.5